jgi:heat-inducible transcriptional repressor
MVILIANTGRVEQRVVDSDGDRDEGARRWSRASARGPAEAAGRASPMPRPPCSRLPERFEPADRDLVELVLGTLDDVLAEEREERVVLAGTGQPGPVRQPTSRGPSRPCSKPSRSTSCCSSCSASSAMPPDRPGSAVAVTIGHENSTKGLASPRSSVRAYGSGSELVAGLGVLGPTRMDYPSAMAAVRAVAHYVSELLEP